MLAPRHFWILGSRCEPSLLQDPYAPRGRRAGRGGAKHLPPRPVRRPTGSTINSLVSKLTLLTPRSGRGTFQNCQNFWTISAIVFGRYNPCPPRACTVPWHERDPGLGITRSRRGVWVTTAAQGARTATDMAMRGAQPGTTAPGSSTRRRGYFPALQFAGCPPNSARPFDNKRSNTGSSAVPRVVAASPESTVPPTTMSSCRQKT